MTLHQWKLFCLFYVTTECALASLSHDFHQTLAFAAGGGFGSSAKSKAKKKPKRKRGGGFADLEPIKEEAAAPKEDAPKLDKWGLPVPTEDDLFPPMPEGTELIACSQGPITSLDEMTAALHNHIPLALEENFDVNGVERHPTPGNEPMKLKLLHKSPPVLSIENFFTHQECQETMAITSNEHAAMQVDSKTFSPLAQSKRTSTSWFCHYAHIPTLLTKADFRLGILFSNMEEPQIVRYRTGEEFSWHYDEVPPTQLVNGGQRLATLLVYLNTVKEGGGTIFRDLQDQHGEELTVSPVEGSALLFFPALADGQPDDRTLHKGQVAHDEKWISQMWIHKEAYRAVVPPGNTHEAAKSAIEQEKQRLGYNTT